MVKRKIVKKYAKNPKDMDPLLKAITKKRKPVRKEPKKKKETTQFAKILSIRKEIWILGIIMILASVAVKYITVAYWIEIDWNPASYHPWAPVFAILGAFCYLGLLHLHKVRGPFLWFSGVLWLGFSALWFWMVNMR